MAAFKIVLPNGEFEVGIAVGTDPSLADEFKLPVLNKGSTTLRAGYAGAWAFSKFSDTSQVVRELYTSAAISCVAAGLCVRVGNAIDGDWRTVISQSTDITEPAPKITYTENSLMTALTLIVATKANWWATNSHTGKGIIWEQDYVGKVLSIKFPNMSVSQELISCVNTIGHWASTLKILGMTDIGYLRVVADPPVAATITLVLSPDAKLWFTSMPAGTDRLAVSYESAKLLLGSPVGKVCPGIMDFMGIPAIRAHVNNDPARYHMGASYLTGKARAAFTGIDMEYYMGRLGTFITRMFPRSTLGQSPHFEKSKLQSYPDYSSEWDNCLHWFKRATTTHAAPALQPERTKMVAVTDAVYATLFNKFSVEVPRDNGQSNQGRAQNGKL